MNIPQEYIDTVDRLCDELKAKKEPRRIVQITATPAVIGESDTYYPALYALCSDGTIFVSYENHRCDRTWEQINVPEIPQ